MYEWEKEPDREHWIDAETGLDCLIVRHPRLKHLCGYVGVPKKHPWHGKGYDHCDVEVHGGLTYAGTISSNICTKEKFGDKSVNHDVWWLGFDCAHFDDLSPGLERYLKLGYYETYKNFAYVENECRLLAAQIKAAI